MHFLSIGNLWSFLHLYIHTKKHLSLYMAKPMWVWLGFVFLGFFLYLSVESRHHPKSVNSFLAVACGTSELTRHFVNAIIEM